MDLKSITLIESIYLFYMFFIFKTSYSFNMAIFDKETQSIGSFFIHDTNHYQNKICDFGRVLAVIAIILAWIRYYYRNIDSTTYTIGFDVVCVILALLMNFNALVYILPLILGEYYVINMIDI